MHGAERKQLTHYLKMSFLDRNFAYFKAHLQALLALQQGNVSKILGPSFVILVPVWSVITSKFRTWRNFAVVAGVWFLIVLEPGVVE